MTLFGSVVAVSRSGTHSFSKQAEPGIRLIPGHGVEGDAHAGATVKHRSRVALNPLQPNLRQVHLLQAELHEELKGSGVGIAPGMLGENVTTRGLDLLGLPVGARLHLGGSAIVEVRGLRSPCAQIEHFRAGLLAAVVSRDEHGKTVLKTGVMGIVVDGGDVAPGDAIRVELPLPPHLPLEKI
ncbi:MAG TPA: MOSC domain-containing protein [Opitutaceae bacterium]